MTELPFDEDDLGSELPWTDDKEVTTTPIDAQEITLNPKLDRLPTDLQCPHCEEPIRGVSGVTAEYRCGCDELRKFRIRGSDNEY